MDRIRVVPDAELTQFHVETGGFPARVEIVAKGARYERRIDYPRGSHQRPMTRDEFEDKVSELTRGHWTPTRQSEVVALAARIDALADVCELTRTLFNPPDARA